VVEADRTKSKAFSMPGEEVKGEKNPIPTGLLGASARAAAPAARNRRLG
jgi:hypothetical protein